MHAASDVALVDPPGMIALSVDEVAEVGVVMRRKRR